jgi:hypothetical protein
MLLAAAVEAAYLQKSGVITVSDQGRVGGDVSGVAEARGANALPVEING